MFIEMAVPEVNKKLLEELEDMGFPRARATWALHYSGESIYVRCHVFVRVIDVRFQTLHEFLMEKYATLLIN